MSTRVIIDADPGIDDAIALLMALSPYRSRMLDVAGITTVGGNAPLARTTRNTLALLEYIGRSNIPVARGAGRPLKGRFLYAPGFHGPGGLSVRLPSPKTTPSEDAVGWMMNILGEAPATIVALGPLTNLARLLQRHPHISGRIDQMVVMGGAVDVPGNTTPYAEFNTYSDPWAAHQVLSSDLPVTLVDLSVCRQVPIERGELGRLSSAAPASRLAARLLENWFRRHPDRDTFDLCDPLAMAVAMDPGILTTRPGTVEVELADPERLGQTTLTSPSGRTKVAKEVYRERFFKLFYESLT